jgi:hypothetical protein
MSKLLQEAQYDKFFPSEVVDILKSKSAESRKKLLGSEQLIQVMLKTGNLLGEISEIESNYIPELESLAVQLVEEAYPIIQDQNIKIIAKIGGKPSEMGCKNCKLKPVSDVEMPEDEKRRIINGITQGSSIRGAYAVNLFGDYLEAIDDSLLQKYNELLNAAFGIYDDEQAIAMLLAMLAQQQKLEGGESEGGYDEETDQLVIKAWGLNFAFLVHEIIKGLYEIISLHGFGTDKEKNQQIVDKVDKLENEPDDLRFGKFIYDAINKLFVESKYTDQRIKEYLFTEIYKLETPEFKSFIENLIKNKLTSSQIKWVNDAMDSIQSDLTKDDTGLTGLDEQFTRMQKLAGVISEEEPISSNKYNLIQKILDKLLKTGELVEDTYVVDFDEMGDAWGEIFKINYGHTYNDNDDKDNGLFAEIQDDAYATLEYKLFKKYGKKIKLELEY